MRFFSLIVCSLVSVTVFAATPFKNSLDEKKNIYMRDGIFTGGKAGHTGNSLLSVRRSFSAVQQLERVIIELGDQEGHPAGRDMGFFQAALDSGNNRIVLDISQLSLSRVNESQIQRIFKNDPYVTSVAMTLDPEDKTGTLVLNLRKPVKLEVFQALKDKQPARIVMDFTPVVASAKTAPMKATAKRVRR